ncbi:SDR family oxidoreductase [Sphaerisporangium aureirubrum]|uniref:SDR family oxidoreductase n=1 Tax=Sphaerisporangium aureirubrum TaxID=1544736 RepID=A0ABW1NDB5_9ACTN
MIAVTGVTGRLGGRIARRLADEGVEQTLVTRSPDRAPRLVGARVAEAEYGDGESARRALRGVGTLCMVSASETPDRVARHRAFVDAAAAAGVRHVVYTSFYGAGPAATFTLARDHWATEEHIRASGMRYTFLRDNLYADFLSLMVGSDDVLRGPAGDGAVSVVALDDIAEACTAVLRSPGEHAGTTYDLTGPQSLTLTEVATTLSEATGRRVTYHPESLPEAYESRAGYGAPRWQLDAWVSTYTAIAAGEMTGLSTAVRDLTGHPPLSLSELLTG